MLRIILAALLLGASLCASAQPYVPLQPGHTTAPWYQPENPGEGVMLSILPTVSGHDIFATIYLAEPSEWFFAQRDHGASFNNWSCPRDWAVCHEIRLYRQPGIGQMPEWYGYLWLRPGTRTIDWLLVIDNGHSSVEAREGVLHPLGPVSGIGWCYTWGAFGPHPPHTDPEWCH
jgi:hypothetical protein